MEGVTDPTSDAGRDPPARNDRYAVVTGVYPHTTASDDSNYEVDVELVGEEGPDGKQQYKRRPVRVGQQGTVRGLEEGTPVTVSYFNDNSERPYVSGVVYSAETRAPFVEPGDWRTRLDESVVETITNPDGDRVVRIGHQPEDRGDLDAGLFINVDGGGFELYDAEGNGICCDGDGEVTVTDMGGARGGSSTSSESDDAPVDTSSSPSSSDSDRPETDDTVHLSTSASPASASSLSSQEIDLAAQGIAEGDTIDPYLEEYFQSDTTLYLPPGDYVWNGGGLDGTYQRAELIGGIPSEDIPIEGDVPPDTGQTVLNQSTGRTGTSTIDVDGGGAGSVHIHNLTIRGQKGADATFSLSVSDPASSLVFESVFLPDGDTTAGTEASIIVPSSHAGTLLCKNLHIEGFRNGGLDARAPGQTGSGGRRGRVAVLGGLYRDNNLANIRLSGAESVVERVTSIQTGAAPTNGTTRNPRAIWLSDYVIGEVLDSDIIYQESTGSPILLGGGTGSPASGTVSNTRIQNDHSAAIIDVRTGEWSGASNHFTGSGNLTPSGGSFSETCSGGKCTPPERSPTRVD